MPTADAAQPYFPPSQRLQRLRIAADEQWMDTDQIDWLANYVTGVETQLQADVITAAGIDGYQRGERAGYLLGLRGTWRWMLVAAIVGATMGIAASLGFQAARAEPAARPAAASTGAPA